MKKAKIVNGLFIFLTERNVRVMEFNYEMGKFELVSLYTSPYKQDLKNEFKNL